MRRFASFSFFLSVVGVQYVLSVFVGAAMFSRNGGGRGGGGDSTFLQRASRILRSTFYYPRQAVFMPCASTLYVG